MLVRFRRAAVMGHFGLFGGHPGLFIGVADGFEYAQFAAHFHSLDHFDMMALRLAIYLWMVAGAGIVCSLPRQPSHIPRSPGNLVGSTTRSHWQTLDPRTADMMGHPEQGTCKAWGIDCLARSF